MREDYTDSTVIIDRSGSMGQQPFLVIETINGYNNFIKEQRKIPGYCAITLVLFDTVNPYEVIYRQKDVHEDVFLNDKIYVPREWTPLNDCVIYAINDAGRRFESMAEKDRPGKVLFLIVTDGLENSSKEYPNPKGRKKVKEMIEHQTKKYNWVFNFLGANFDAEAEGETMGIARGSTVTMASMANVGRGFGHYSSNTKSYREGTSATMDWGSTQKEDLAKNENE